MVFKSEKIRKKLQGRKAARAARFKEVLAGVTTKAEFIKKLEDAKIDNITMDVWFAYGRMAD